MIAPACTDIGGGLFWILSFALVITLVFLVFYLTLDLVSYLSQPKPEPLVDPVAARAVSRIWDTAREAQVDIGRAAQDFLNDAYRGARRARRSE